MERGIVFPLKQQEKEKKMNIDLITGRIAETTATAYWRFISENSSSTCDRCSGYDGKVFSDDDPAKPVLPLHPNCRCRWRAATAEEAQTAMIPIAPAAVKRPPVFAGGNYDDIIQKIINIYRYKTPKPPRNTANKANWLKMTWMWFFEKGLNPIHFSIDSPESKDIAESFSMKEVKAAYFKTGQIPTHWSFTGSKTATGELGEVEWFIGSYAIRNFKLNNGIATFTVYNKSGWHSGTRLPKSWRDTIKEATSYDIVDLVTDAPRGEVIKTKIKKYFPESAKIPGSGYILELLPSYGGDWEQYYNIRMEWKE